MPRLHTNSKRFVFFSVIFKIHSFDSLFNFIHYHYHRPIYFFNFNYHYHHPIYPLHTIPPHLKINYLQVIITFAFIIIIAANIIILSLIFVIFLLIFF